MKILALNLTYQHTGATKRSTKASGIVGAPVAYLSNLKVSHTMPIDPSGLAGLQQQNIVQTLTEASWVYVKGVEDIEAGDRITVDSVEYIVRLAQTHRTPGAMPGADYMRLTVERLVT